jgi:hypothetical protein
MKDSSCLMAEMATIEDMSLSSLKSMLAIHCGQSLCSLTPMRETKFT